MPPMISLSRTAISKIASRDAAACRTIIIVEHGDIRPWHLQFRDMHGIAPNHHFFRRQERMR